VLRLAVAAYLARFKGQSRVHTESDLRGYLRWCESRQLDPLAATRPQIELYVRWLEALLTAARTSANRCDFALVTMLGLLGLRIFEATGSNIEDLGEEHGHRVLRVRGKGGKVVLVPTPQLHPRRLHGLRDLTQSPVVPR
jgi:integrase/recombinase XerD